MLKLIIGVKGTGKTKALINLVNEAVEKTHGDVVCIEKGVKLRFDIKYRARLIDVNEYFVDDAQSLYGEFAVAVGFHEAVEGACHVKGDCDAVCFFRNLDEFRHRLAADGVDLLLSCGEIHDLSSAEECGFHLVQILGEHTPSDAALSAFVGNFCNAFLGFGENSAEDLVLF